MAREAIAALARQERKDRESKPVSEYDKFRDQWYTPTMPKELEKKLVQEEKKEVKEETKELELTAEEKEAAVKKHEESNRKLMECIDYIQANNAR